MAIPKPNVPKVIRSPRAGRIMQALTAPPVPHLDIRANGAIAQNSLFDQSGPHADPDNPTISEAADPGIAYDLSKAESESVYQAAKARSQPDQPMPAWSGLQGVDFYPFNFTDTDGVTHTGSSIGQTTPFEGLKSRYGAERAEEQARNFIDRRKPQAFPLEDETAPNMHQRGGDEHFNRKIFIARHSGPAIDNGSMFPGHDIGVWAKGDDSAGMISHELDGHAVMDASPFDGPNKHHFRDPQDHSVWGAHIAKRPEDIFSGLLEEAAEKHGYEVDPITGETDFLGDRGASEIFEQLSRRYPTLPYEMRARGLVFKNRSLQAHGFKTLKEAGDETAFLKKALMSDIMHPDDANARSIHPTFDVEDYNKELMYQKSIFHSLDKAGKIKWLNMMLRAGMLGAPAAMAAGQGEDQ